MLEFGRALPHVRTTVARQLQGPDLSRERVLAAAVRLIDLGFFRSGGDEYAADNGSFGLATILREHVTCHKDEITFSYVGKSGKRQVQVVADDMASPVVRRLKRRRSWTVCDDLLVFRSGSRWHNVTAGTSTTTCGHLRRRLHRQGLPHLARDRAGRRRARGLAGRRSPTARKRAATRVVHEVAVPGRPPLWPAPPALTRGSSPATRRAPRSRRRWPTSVRDRNSATWPPRAGPSRPCSLLSSRAAERRRSLKSPSAGS